MFFDLITFSHSSKRLPKALRSQQITGMYVDCAVHIQYTYIPAVKISIEHLLIYFLFFQLEYFYSALFCVNMKDIFFSYIFAMSFASLMCTFVHTCLCCLYDTILIKVR